MQWSGGDTLYRGKSICIICKNALIIYYLNLSRDVGLCL